MVDEPSVVAIRKSDDSMYAVGRKASVMQDIYEPMAAAIGMGFDIEGPQGCMVVDIGGGTTEIAVMALGSLVVPISYQEIAHCLDKNIMNMETAILQALGDTPSELYADIVEHGIYLTGGGALLHGLAQRLSQRMTIPFHVADDPLHSVAKGTGIALQNLNSFGFLIRGE